MSRTSFLCPRSKSLNIKYLSIPSPNPILVFSQWLRSRYCLPQEKFVLDGRTPTTSTHNNLHHTNINKPSHLQTIFPIKKKKKSYKTIPFEFINYLDNTQHPQLHDIQYSTCEESTKILAWWIMDSSNKYCKVLSVCIPMIFPATLTRYLFKPSFLLLGSQNK